MPTHLVSARLEGLEEPHTVTARECLPDPEAQDTARVLGARREGIQERRRLGPGVGVIDEHVVIHMHLKPDGQVGHAAQIVRYMHLTCCQSESRSQTVS